MSLSVEDQLMKKVAEGCQKSFGQLFELHGSLILGYAVKLLQNKAFAEDIAQEVWVKLVKAAPNYQAQGQFKSWVLTMTRNLCFNKMKADRRLTFVEDTTQVEGFIEPSENFEEQLIVDQKMEGLKRVLDQLPENQRISLLMVAAEGLSYEEVAHELSISVSATKSLIHRARKTINEKLKKEAL